MLVIVRLQQVVLHGCFLTLLEVQTGGLPKGHVYMQLVSQRFFGHRLSRRRGVRNAIALHIFLTLLISIVASHYNYRIRL